MRATSLLTTTVACLLLATQTNVTAAADIVLERGGAELTLEDIDGRMQRLPAHERAEVARQSDRMARMLGQLLLNRQLAMEARELGLDQDPKVARDMVLAAEEVLAVHRLNELVREDSLPDFNQLARERYLSDPQAYAIEGQRTIEHILIATESRTEGEALELALEVYDKAIAPGASFAELVAEHSEDPGKPTNAGRYEIRERGQFVPEFEAAARALKEVNEISAPVRTDFGFHIIRLVDSEPDTIPKFEEVEVSIVQRLRMEYLSTTRDRHTANLRQIEDSGDEELLRSLRARYGGEAPLPAARD